MKKKLFILPYLFALWSLTITSQAQSQVNSDGSLSTRVTNINGNNKIFVVNGGSESKAGNNLFHSFDKFSVPDGGSVSFNNANHIQNIITRVTGRYKSEINGSIEANGSANFFLLNSNGIIFGPKASLNVGGSFLASTANLLKFADGSKFSTTLQASPVLTISSPSSLHFSANPRSITNRSQAEGKLSFPEEEIEVPVGLQVQTNKTLAFVGGDILLNGGNLTAQAGRIDIGSVAGPSFVGLKPSPKGWTVKYEGTQNFQDIQLSQGASIRTTSAGGGVIQLHGKEIIAADTSSIVADHVGEKSGRSRVLLNASESIELRNASRISAASRKSDESISQLNINTERLVVRDRSSIEALSEESKARTNIAINALESVEISGGAGPSRISAQVSIGEGDAGKISITTAKLKLLEGGRIDASTFGIGTGGSIVINASIVEASGQSSDETFSGLFVQNESPKPGGNLEINTEQLLVQNGAKVSADSNGAGAAGDLEIDADHILLRDGGQIVTNATSTKGGNIFIDTKTLVGSNDSDITANARNGAGGLIQINAQAVIGLVNRDELTDENDITAFSEENPELSGIVEINTPDANLNERAQLPQDVINVAHVIDQNLCATGSGGSEFSIIGRGGLPQSPSSIFSPDDTWEDWRIVEDIERATLPPAESVQPFPSQTKGTRDIIIEAQGWVRNADGNIILTAQANITTPQGITPPQGCQHLAEGESAI